MSLRPHCQIVRRLIARVGLAVGMVGWSALPAMAAPPALHAFAPHPDSVMAASDRSEALHDHDPAGCDYCAAAKLRAAADLGEAAIPEGGLAGSSLSDTDVQHYTLDLTVTPALDHLNGTCTMEVMVVAESLEAFEFRLSDAFLITSLTVDGVVAAWQRLDPIHVRVTLDPPRPADAIFDLTVSYEGVPTSLGLNSIVFQNRGFPAVRVFYTLSEPWFAYTWWPQKDDNNDKATGTLIFTVPGNYSVASNGLLTEEVTLPSTQKRYRWETAYQTTPYLFSMGGANYVRFGSTFDHAGGSMPMQFFLYPDSNTTSNRNRCFQTADMLAAFGNIFGPYPFINEKYGIYQFGFSGGMEHQTMTGQGVFSESITAHEVGHQWWGNMITCATWSDIWLQEGMATYCEALWQEFKPGGGPSLLQTTMNNRRPSSVNGTVYIPNPTTVNRIFSSDFSYRKAAWVFHMLRRVVGSATFFDILAAFRAAHEDGTATTVQFVAIAEAVHGEPLDWFFNPWLYQVGAPEYRYAWRTLNLGEKSYVELYLTQIQSLAWPTFTMPVDVLVATSETQSTTTPVWNNARAQHYLLPQPAPPLGLALDPKDWVLIVSKQETPFVEGPPKIIATSPEPGQLVADLDQLLVRFHKPVNLTTFDFLLESETGGEVPVSVAYNALEYQATLTPGGVLGSDRYRLTVWDGVTDVASSQRLDGEVADPLDPASLPSGDGLPGGTFVIEFIVTLPVLLGDMNCDGAVNNFDIDPFVLALVDPAAYAEAFPLCNPMAGDVDGDGHFDNFDIDPFVLHLLH
ncbi:MAG: hypothetical protein IPM64_12070 [Phycisphaerales bacterium]|nr:hypothetical protein [Phycisphaerales bacterium]